MSEKAVKPLSLRVDVCTFRALRDGVPGVLEVLRRTGARATFFVAFGPDSSGRALLKLLRPSFAWKMLRTGAARTYGLAAALYGTLLPPPLVGAGLPDAVRRIREEGHEVGAHGWDHRRWQDGIARFPRSRLEAEWRRMAEAHSAALGVPPASFAAPAWMATADLLEIEEEAGIRFAGDCRGAGPFLPVLQGREFKVPQLPVTLPTLDERLGTADRKKFVEETIDLICSQPDYACFCAHAEMEGREYRPELEAIIRWCGRPVAPLGEVPLENLPRRAVNLGPIPGRTSPVCQEEVACRA